MSIIRPVSAMGFIGVRHELVGFFMLGCSQVSVNMMTLGLDQSMVITISSFLCLILWAAHI